ncbi:hypothetical protein Peur_039121 [Populus x canadensis]
MGEVSRFTFSLSDKCSSKPVDKTLAVTHRLLPLNLRLPATSPVNLNVRLSISSSSSRGCALKCSASTPDNQAARFQEASKNGNLIPLYRCIFSDHVTPMLAYRCLVREDDRDAPSFLFESVEPGLDASTIGRYSVIGAQPSMEIVAKENMVTIMDNYEGRRREEIVEDPMEVPRRIMEGWKPQFIDELFNCILKVCLT